MKMIRRPILFICLVFLVTHGTSRADPTVISAPDTTEVSHSVEATGVEHAAGVSRMTTGVSTIVGFGLAYAAGHGTGNDFPGAAVLGSVVGSLGVIAGPSVGWFMRGQSARAWGGIALRTTGAVLLLRGVMKEDEDGNGRGLEIAGAAIVLGDLGWDLVTVGKAPGGPHPTTVVRLEPVLIAAREGRLVPGFEARARF